MSSHFRGRTINRKSKPNREDPLMRDYVKSLRIALVAVILVLGLSQGANAQEITGAIVGTVKDSVGASVAGATVTVTNRATQIAVRTVQANDEGQYAVGDLPATNY